jgi:CRISPR-associated exonuclease Cas4
MLLAFAFLLALFALLLFWLAGQQRKAAGLPGGRVIYADMRGWGPLEKPLYDPELGLAGKPDYLVEKGSQIIPVEVKTAHRGNQPYDSHIYQLAAYCLLVERVLGKRPPYGILHYTGGRGPGGTYAIDYTPQLERAVIDLLAEMRSLEHRKEVERSHTSPARCARCGFRSMCDQKIQ